MGGVGMRAASIVITVEVADRSTVEALLDGIERTDLVEIEGRAFLLD